MATKSRASRKSTDAVAALVAKARAAAQHAYAPYSGFAVGAVVETTNGIVFSGANMENVSYGVSVCAEVGALQAASSAGQLDKIRTLVVVSGPIDPPPGYQPQPSAPCGRCRQLISEAATLGGRDIDIWFGDLGGHELEHRKISQLLPGAFGPQILK